MPLQALFAEAALRLPTKRVGILATTCFFKAATTRNLKQQAWVLAQFVIPAKAGRRLDSARIQIFLFCPILDAHFRGHDNFLLKLSQHPGLLLIKT